MTTKEEIDKMKAELAQKERARKQRIASKKYVEEKEEIKRRSFTSFGKLILSKEKTSPIINFGVAKKFNKSGAVHDLKTPGPIYNVLNNKFKYKVVSNQFFIYMNNLLKIYIIF